MEDYRSKTTEFEKRTKFKSLLEIMAKSFGRSTPSNEEIAFIYGYCSYFEALSYDFLLDKYQELNAPPPNKIKALKGFYAEWLRTQPAVDRQCKSYFCHDGWVFYAKQADGIYQLFVSKCWECSKGASLQVLEAQGKVFTNRSNIQRELDRLNGVEREVENYRFPLPSLDIPYERIKHLPENERLRYADN